MTKNNRKARETIKSKVYVGFKVERKILLLVDKYEDDARHKNEAWKTIRTRQLSGITQRKMNHSVWTLDLKLSQLTYIWP